MAQRSPYNDRYKTDQKGKTRKSASASKPKRAIADITPAQAAKASQKKKSLWSRAKSAGSTGKAATKETLRIESTPRMLKLRRIWWWLWGGALLVAVVILAMQQMKVGSPGLIAGAWVIWLSAMGGAFYLEFGPIRRERALAIAAAQAGGKPSKADKADKSDKSDKPAKLTKAAQAVKAAADDAPEPDDRQPPSQDGAE